MTMYDARVTLGFQPGHTPVKKDLLKKQFKKMCFKYHPDRCKDTNIDACGKFIEVREAYNFLSRQIQTVNGHAKTHGWRTSSAPPHRQPSARSPPPPPPSSSHAKSSKGTKNKNISDSHQSRVADENLVPLLDAIKTLGLCNEGKSSTAISMSTLEVAYKRSVLKLYVKHKQHNLEVKECDDNLGCVSTAFERLLLHIDFNKHWDPPYSEQRRPHQRKEENVIISEYVQRQRFLQNQQVVQLNERREAKLRADEEEWRSEQAEKKKNAEERSKRGVELCKKYGASLSLSHGQRYREEIEQEQEMQINQQYAAQEQHKMDYYNNRDDQIKPNNQTGKRKNSERHGNTGLLRPRTRSRSATGLVDDPIEIEDEDEDEDEDEE